MSGPGGRANPQAPARVRLDKWLWHARFFKSRSLATELVASGHLRLNGIRVSKPGHAVSVQDVLTFPQGDAVRLIRVLALAERRGGAPDASLLYLDLDAPEGRNAATALE